MVVAGRSRLKETLGRFERQAHLPGHNHEERLGWLILAQDHRPCGDVAHRGVSGEPIDVIRRECFEKRGLPEKFSGRFYQAPGLGISPVASGRTNVARLFQPVCEDRCDALGQQIPETRLRLYQLHYDFAGSRSTRHSSSHRTVAV
jgi:hypothetical protein